MGLSPSFWLRADADSPFADQSGNSNDATETGSVSVVNYAINGRAAIDFDGDAANYLRADGAASSFAGDSTPVTMAIVWDTPKDLSGSAEVLLQTDDNGGGRDLTIRKGATGQLLLVTDDATTTDSTIMVGASGLTDRKTYCLILTKSATQTDYIVYSWSTAGALETIASGTVSDKHNVDLGTQSRMSIGGQLNGSQPTVSHVGEIVIFPSSLGTTDQATLLEWLKERWIEPPITNAAAVGMAGLRSAISSASNPPRIVFMGDSYSLLNSARFSYPLGMRLPLGAPITGWFEGFANNPINAINFTGLTVTNTFTGVGNATDYLTEGGTVRFGLPVNTLQELTEDGTGTYGTGGGLASITSDFAQITGSITNGLSNATGIAARLAYKASVAQYSRDMRIEDGNDSDTRIQTSDMVNDARKFIHLDEGDPDAASRTAPVYGQMNAIYPDIVMRETDGSGDISIRLEDPQQTNAAIATTGKHAILGGLLAYAIDGSNDRVPGVYYSFLHETSWDMFGFGDDEESDATTIKRFTESQFRHWLDITTLDVDQPVVYILHLATEGNGAAQALRETHATMNLLETAHSAIGLPEPRIWIVGGPRLTTDTIAMHNGVAAAARQRPRIATTSLYYELDSIYFDGTDPAQDTWLTDNGYEPFIDTVGSINTSLAGDDLLSDNVHPTDATAAAFFTAVSLRPLNLVGSTTLRRGKLDGVIGRPLRGKL